MAKNLNTVVTREEAVEQFNELVIPLLMDEEAKTQGGTWQYVDEILRREAWSNWTDGLRLLRRISDWQYENWSQPDCCEG